METTTTVHHPLCLKDSIPKTYRPRSTITSACHPTFPRWPPSPLSHNRMLSTHQHLTVPVHLPIITFFLPSSTTPAHYHPTHPIITIAIIPTLTTTTIIIIIIPMSTRAPTLDLLHLYLLWRVHMQVAPNHLPTVTMHLSERKTKKWNNLRLD